MANIRRTARELALKALFQVEVGKQPLPEVLDGVLDQVRITVRNPIAHVLLDVQAEIKGAVARHAEDLSTASARRLRTAARGCSRQILVLVDALADQIDLAISVGDPAPIGNVREAAREALDMIHAGLARIATRETLYPEALAEVTGAAERGSAALVRVLGPRLASATQIAAFTKSLVEGALANKADVDAVIAKTATGWSMDRLAAVDRNILRIGAFELLFCPGVPPAAAINEAVELAKKYSTAESGRFVNGVLGALPRAGADPVAAGIEEEV